MANGRSVTGRVKAEERHRGNHHQGFNEAMEHALDRLSKEVGTGDYPVEVRFHADVKVSNPGTIGFYAVTLERTGGA
jgi:hypothetical protein